MNVSGNECHHSETCAFLEASETFEIRPSAMRSFLWDMRCHPGFQERCYNGRTPYSLRSVGNEVLNMKVDLAIFTLLEKT